MKTLILFSIISMLFCSLPVSAADDWYDAEIGPESESFENVRKYYDERSYRWAIESALNHDEKYPYSQYSAELDYIIVYSRIKLGIFDNSIDDLEKIMKNYRGTVWSVNAADLYMDIFSGSGSRRDEMDQHYGLNSYSYSERSSKRLRLRKKALETTRAVYRSYISKLPKNEQMKWNDRIVLNYIDMMSNLDFGDSYYDDKDTYSKTTKYINNILKFEMSPDMRSALEYSKAGIIYSSYPVDTSGFDELSMDDFYDWRNAKRFDLTIDELERVAAKYEKNIGGVYARAALAHLDVVYYNEAARGASKFDSIGADIGNAGTLRAITDIIRSPALAILKVKSNPFDTPGTTVQIGSKVYDDIELTIYPVADEEFFKLPASLDAVDLFLEDGRKIEINFDNTKVDLAGMAPLNEKPAAVKPKPTSELAGVGEPVLIRKVKPDFAGEPSISVTDIKIDNLDTGLYIAEVAAGENIARTYFLHSEVSLFYTGNDEAIYFQLVSADNGEPLMATDVIVYEVYNEIMNEGESDEFRVKRIDEIEFDDKPKKSKSGNTFNLNNSETGQYTIEFTPTNTGKDTSDPPRYTKSELLLIAKSDYGPAFANVNATGLKKPTDYNEIGIAYTDRPLYRPGNSIAFKAILREVDFNDKLLRPATDRRVEVRAITPFDEEIWKSILISDEYGVISGDFDVPIGAALGVYKLRFKWDISEIDEDEVKDSEDNVADDNDMASYEEIVEEAVSSTEDSSESNAKYDTYCSFEIEEYEKPEYELSLTAEKLYYYSGDTIRIVAEGSYFFGSPMADSLVEYKIYRSGETSKRYGYEWRELKKKGEGRTDKNGRYTIEFKSDYGGKFDNDYTVEVKITDDSNHIVEEEIEVETSVVDTTLTLGTDQYEYHWDDNIWVNISVKDWSSQPRSVPVDIVAYPYSYYSYSGSSKKETPVFEETVITDENGKAKVLIKLETEPLLNALSITATTTDGRGTEIIERDTIRFVEEDEEPYSWKREVNVIYSEGTPSPGDTITVRISSKFTDVTAEIMVYGDGFINVENVPLLNDPEGGSYVDYQVFIEDEYAPELRVKATIIKGGSYFDDYTNISVKNANISLNIDIDITRDEYIPGELADVRIECTDQYGDPVVTNLSLSGVDESLLALSSDNTYNLPSKFGNALSRSYDRYTGNTLKSRGEIATATYYFQFYEDFYRSGAPLLKGFPRSAKSAISAFGYPPGYANLRGEYVDRFFGLSGTDKLNPYSYRYIKLFEGKDTIYGGAVFIPMVTRTEIYEGKGGMDTFQTEEYIPEFDEKDLIKGRNRLNAYLASTQINDYLGNVLAKPGENTETIQIEGETFRQAHIRAYFSDSAYWKPDLLTDEAGVATLKVDLPDNLTLWRFMALGVDDGQRIGWNFDRCNVSKDVLVRIKTPRYMVTGDTARIKAIAHNYTSLKRDFAISLNADRLYNSAGDEDKIVTSIDAGFSFALENDMYAASPGRTTFVATALSSVESDATTSSINIIPKGIHLRQSFCGRLRNKAEHNLVLTDDITPETFRSEMIVVPSLSKVLSNGLDYYAEYPYSCVEQTLNRFLVNALLAEAAEKINLDETSLSGGLAKAIEVGIVQMEGQQNKDGGFPWWRGGKTSPYITAYAVDGLYTLKGNPYLSELAAIKLENMLQSSSIYLTNFVNHYDSNQRKYGAELNLYITDVVLRHGLMQPDERNIRNSYGHYFEDRDPLSTRGLILLGSVAYHKGDMEDVGVVMRNLDNNVQRDSDDTIYFGRNPEDCWYWWGDAVETTAKVLNLKILADPDSEQIPEMVNWLVDKRRGAAWKSTKDSAEATKALINYIASTSVTSRTIKVDYNLNGTKGSLKPDPEEYENPGETVAFEFEDFKTGDNKVELKRKSGKTPVFYTVFAEYYTEADEIPAMTSSVSIERDYYKIKGKRKKGEYVEVREPLDGTIEIGDEIVVELTVNSPYDFDFVMIEDPRPAGLVFADTKSGYDGWSDVYVELRTEKRVLMVDRLRKGENKFSYRLIAEVAGDYAALPATVKGMYNPDIGGSTTSTRLIVEE